MTASGDMVCLVTGGSRGIGAATALAAARQGYRVCVNYLTSMKEAMAIVAAIENEGGKAIAVRADVSREDEVADLFAAIDRELGLLTALVNNAALPGDRRDLADIETGLLRRVVDVNLIGTFLCTRAAAARMAKSRGGKGGAIVNLSSTVTRTGGYRLSAYVASKAGIEGLTKALAPELAAEGIRINAVSPGIIATERLPLQDSEWRARTLSTIALGRLGTSEEIAEVILWILSSKASYVTGAIVEASGGR